MKSLRYALVYYDEYESKHIQRTERDIIINDFNDLIAYMLLNSSNMAIEIHGVELISACAQSPNIPAELLVPNEPFQRSLSLTSASPRSFQPTDAIFYSISRLKYMNIYSKVLKFSKASIEYKFYIIENFIKNILELQIAFEYDLYCIKIFKLINSAKLLKSQTILNEFNVLALVIPMELYNSMEIPEQISIALNNIDFYDRSIMYKLFVSMLYDKTCTKSEYPHLIIKRKNKTEIFNHILKHGENIMKSVEFFYKINKEEFKIYKSGIRHSHNR